MKKKNNWLNYQIKPNNSEPACMICLPPAPLKDHHSINGIIVHTRIDAPKNKLYLLDEDYFKLDK